MIPAMGKGQVRDYQWSIVVDEALDKKAKAAAAKAGMNLSTWIRTVVRKQLGMPTL